MTTSVKPLPSLAATAMAATLVLAVSAPSASAVSTPAGTTSRISVTSDGADGNDHSGHPAFSGNGRFVAFQSYADNLVADDDNLASDIFVVDRLAGETSRVSVATDGSAGNGSSFLPAISRDGRYVAFISKAGNLVANDTNDCFGFNCYDVFVRDRATPSTVRVSVASDGTQANGNSDNPSISADGRFIAFQSDATNLSTGSVGGIYVHDLLTHETEQVDVTPDGWPTSYVSEAPAISADGRFVVFAADGRDLVRDDTNLAKDIFVRDRKQRTTVRVSLASEGTEGNNSSYDPQISDDGRWVVFQSYATNLVDADSNGFCAIGSNCADIFVHDRENRTTRRVSVDSSGRQANGASEDPAISADGRFIAFTSLADNLTSGDINNDYDVFVHDQRSGRTVLVSVASDGTRGNKSSFSPATAASGRMIAFGSRSSNLVAGDQNRADDVFVFDISGRR